MGDSAKTKKPAVKAAPKVKKMPKTTAPAAHPKYREMIVTAIQAMKSRTGSSRQAILQHVIANNNVAADQAANYVKLALKKGLDNGVLRTAKDSGKGAGSFKLTEDYKQVSKIRRSRSRKWQQRRLPRRSLAKLPRKLIRMQPRNLRKLAKLRMLARTLLPRKFLPRCR